MCVVVGDEIGYLVEVFGFEVYVCFGVVVEVLLLVCD